MKTLFVKCQFGNHQHEISIENAEGEFIHVYCPIARKTFPIAVTSIKSSARYRSQEKKK
jgi:hypothetical protein